jgi:ribosomal protein S12 methylthiotransferase
VAQDTALYGIDLYGEVRLAELLESLDGLCGEMGAGDAPWIRLMYAYPEHISDEVIQAMAGLRHVCKYLDMPVQHSEDGVLMRMGRKGSRAELRKLIERLRAVMPDITLRTTLMVGFPGESAKEFAGLCNFVEETRFDRLGVFPYSREDGTAAAQMPKQVSERVKEARRNRLMELQQGIHAAKQSEKIGKSIAVMVDGNDPNGNDPRRYIGRTQGDAHEVDSQVYFFHEEELTPGDIIELVPTASDEYDIYA